MIFIGVDVAIFEHVGVHHAGAEDFHPFLFLVFGGFAEFDAAVGFFGVADVHFGAWFHEGEEAGAETVREEDETLSVEDETSPEAIELAAQGVDVEPEITADLEPESTEEIPEADIVFAPKKRMRFVIDAQV